MRKNLGQLESYSYDGDLVYRMSILGGGFELNSLGHGLGLFIQSMPQTAEHLQDLHMARSREAHFELYVTLDLQLPGFGVYTPPWAWKER